MNRDNHRCENCGRKLICEPCEARATQARQEAFLDDVATSSKERQPILIWFHMPLAMARQHLNRLAQEWPGALEIIEPIEPGDWLGCRVALRIADVGRNPLAEYALSDQHVQRVDDSFQRAFEELLRRGL